MSELQEKNSPYVVGIDLGTSTSILAIYRKGRPEVIPISGERVTPSAVSYRADTAPLIGVQAKRRTLIDPENTVVSIKREIGNASYDRTVCGQKITPEAVSALILEHLKNGATEHVEGNARKAIITIPANFENNQRQATLEAGRLAGLEVLQLVEEPVAAAVAYGFGSERDQTILVYDLGGGTFDVCILKVDTQAGGQAKFRVLGKAGIPKLGGDDFDDAIMAILAAELVKAGGPDVLDLKKDQGVSKKKLRTACQTLKEKAEIAKIELTDAEKVAVDAPNLIKNENGQEFHLSCELTREQFNAAVKPLLEQSTECIRQALVEAKLTAEDIDRIILVGGSTRVPCVRTMVTEMFGKEPYGDIEPDTAVAQGAAIIGASLSEAAEKPPVNYITTTSHFLGIETVGRRFNEILPKNSDVPAENKKVYATTYDNMKEIRISIFQFPEKVEFIDLKVPGSACLGEFYLGPLREAPKGQVHVEVRFGIDQNGMLTVAAQELGAAGGGQAKQLEIRVS
ncbi:MAG: Hsp70 family protein [Planctomycetes bacterium]|nr:Hsp70 family protein [Planctomycetota bacterium]